MAAAHELQDDGRSPLLFVRALARHAQPETKYRVYVDEMLLDDPSMKWAREQLHDGGLFAYSDKGRSLLFDMKVAFERVLQYSKSGAPAFDHLDQACRAVSALLEKSEAGVRKAVLEAPDILSCRTRESLMQCEALLLSAFCYTVAMLYGVKHLVPIRDLALNSMDDIVSAERACQSIIESLATGCKPIGCWTIRETIDGGTRFMPLGRGYFLVWEDMSLSEVMERYGMRLLSPNVGVAQGDGGKAVLCGIGNVVGTAVRDSLKLRARGVHEDLPSDAFSAVGMRADNLLLALQSYFNGDDAYCIHPDDIARALDRYSRVSERGVVR